MTMPPANSAPLAFAPDEVAKTGVMSAIAEELRIARELLEELAGVLIGDERFITEYIDQLQAFDLIAQHIDESASLLNRVAAGQDFSDSLDQVRLHVMQERLRANIGGKADIWP